MTVMKSYLRAQDEFDAILAAVSPQAWDRPSACTEWTVRDVVGHVIWGQDQLRRWANGASTARTWIWIPVVRQARASSCGQLGTMKVRPTAAVIMG
jgi:uncharacterized protein (TIGR03083 family)